MKLNKRQSIFLQLLQISTPKERKALMNGATNADIKMLSEIIFNMLYGNVRLSKDKLHQLRRHKQYLREISNRQVSLVHKRAILRNQSGGSLFPILLPILSTVVGKLQ
jgi:hypothetical protein